LYKKQKPVAQKSIEPVLNDRIIQLQNEAAAVSCEYKLDDYDIAELVFERYCDKFPDSHYVDLHKMIRVQRSDEKEFLIYYTAEEVTDSIQFKRIPFNRKRIGFHAKVTGLPEYDNYGTLTGYDIGTPSTVFDIPFDPQEIKKIIATARSGPRELIIGKAASVGEHPMLGTYYTCPNLENWLYGDLDLLISAQKLGYLKADPSGFEEYLNIRAKNLHHGDTTTTKNDSEKK
jgi:hypothetical protein